MQIRLDDIHATILNCPPERSHAEFLLATGREVKYASTHDLRRTFAVRLHQSRIPPHLITKLMRHSDYRVTERYYVTETTQEDAGQIREILRSVSPGTDRTRSQTKVESNGIILKSKP